MRETLQCPASPRTAAPQPTDTSLFVLRGSLLELQLADCVISLIMCSASLWPSTLHSGHSDFQPFLADLQQYLFAALPLHAWYCLLTLGTSVTFGVCSHAVSKSV